MKRLEIIVHILGMLIWLGLALLAFLQGERFGPIIAFFGLLTYAMGEDFYNKIDTIANQALEGWGRSIDQVERLLNERNKNGT